MINATAWFDDDLSENEIFRNKLLPILEHYPILFCKITLVEDLIINAVLGYQESHDIYMCSNYIDGLSPENDFKEKMSDVYRLNSGEDFSFYWLSNVSSADELVTRIKSIKIYINGEFNLSLLTDLGFSIETF